jgi:hypothetical protein
MLSKSSNLGTRNRQKGHHAARFYADVFRKLGYPHCITARLGARQYDNAGIDIINIPFNFQIKAGKQSKLSAGKILLQMESQIKSLFPPKHEVRTFPLYVIHRPNPFSKGYEEDLVYMTLKQYEDIAKVCTDLKYVSYKKRNVRMTTNFGEIVAVKFSDLIKYKVFDCKDEEV